MTVTDSILFLSLNNSAFSQDEQIAEVCIANINPKERKERVRFAVQQLVRTLVVVGGLVLMNVDPRWRLTLVFQFKPATPI